MVKVFRSIFEQIAENKSYSERWGTKETSLISAWEAGRKNRDTIFSHLVEPLSNGALPKLNFKGGHKMPFDEEYTKPAKYKYKYGTFEYLAERQGILNKDLDIDTSRDNGMILTCTLTKLKTVFTANQEKYKENKTFNKKLQE